MTNKPEALRTCEPECGGRDIRLGQGIGARGIVSGGRWYSSEACYRAGRPLNPAPRPVESHESLALGYALHGMDFGVEMPRPVERCSCDEATRYRAALEVIAVPFATDIADVRDIARRALALGEEET